MAQVEKEDPSAQSRNDRQRGANYSFLTANIMEVGVDFPYRDNCGAAIKAEDLKCVTCTLAAGEQVPDREAQGERRVPGHRHAGTQERRGDPAVLLQLPGGAATGQRQEEDSTKDGSGDQKTCNQMRPDDPRTGSVTN